MKKYLLVLSLSLISFAQLFSQQQSLNNFYVQNLFSINPATTGIQSNIAGYLDIRDQWSGLKGAPEIISFGLHSLVSPNMGLGLNFEQNEVGIFKQFVAEINYSYRLLIAQQQSLAFGLKAGYSKTSLNYDVVEAAQNNDVTLYSSSTGINETLIRVGSGIHYNNKNFNAHISAPVLYGQQEEKYFQTIYGLVSYDLYATENIWKFQPSVLYRHMYASPGQVDVNLLSEWDKKLWGLLSYRTNKSFAVGVGLYHNGFGVGYSYEVNRNNFSSVSGGSHEVIITYEAGTSLTKSKPHYKSSKRSLTR